MKLDRAAEDNAGMRWIAETSPENEPPLHKLGARQGT
jgi:hypothetical protein